MEAIALEYEKETGTKVELQYGGSGLLLSNLEVSKQGDVYIAADESYVKQAQAKGLVTESLVIARQHPVLAVKAGNPKKITSVADLLKPGIKYAIANPETASIGKLCQRVFTAKGTWAQLSSHVTVMKPTVSDVANDLIIGTVDASFVWDATVAQLPGLGERGRCRNLPTDSENVTAGILKSAKDSAQALLFAQYLAAPDKGGLEFKKRGYSLAGSPR